MVFNPDNVLTGIYDGGIYAAPVGSGSPTSAAGPWIPLGISLSVLDNANPPTLSGIGEGEVTAVTVWQRAQVIRHIRTPNEESPTLTATIAEVTPELNRLAYGVNAAGPGGGVVINAGAERPHFACVFDVLTATGGRRYFAPNAVITETGETVFSNDGAIAGIPVTIAFDYDSALGGNVVYWDVAGSTAWASPVNHGETPYAAPIAEAVSDDDDADDVFGVRQYAVPESLAA